MKILFIYFDVGVAVYNQLGIAYLSASLKEKNHKVSLLRIHKANKIKRIAKNVRELKPDLVGLSFVSHFAYLARKLSEEIRKEYSVPIIAGGVHATIEPFETISYEGIDFVCVGEGEKALIELVTKLEKNEDISNIKNIWVKKNNNIIKTPVRELIDLDKLPIPDVDIFYKNPSDVKRVALMTQRGCPFSCTYCCNEYLKILYKDKGPIVRKRSLSNVMRDIDIIVKNHPNIKDIVFDDDNFIVDKQRVKAFCLLYEPKFKIPFSINSRPDLIDSDTAKTLKKACCSRINIGIESGDEAFRKKHLKRHISNKSIINAFDIVKKADIAARGFLIYGFPFESEENMKNSYSLLKKISPTDGSQVSVFYPYPKSSLYESCQKLDLLTKQKKFTFLGNKTTLNFNNKKKVLIRKYYELSEDIHHSSEKNMKYIEKFYPILKIPFTLLTKFIPRKIVWRSMYRIKMYYLKKPFTFKAGW